MTFSAQPWLTTGAAGLGRGWRRDLARDAVALGVVTLGYFTLFLLTRDVPLVEIVQATLRNSVSLALVATLMRPWVRRVLKLKPAVQTAMHAMLALGFSLVWLWVLTVVGALLGAPSVMRFEVNPFLVGPAAEWQMFQGLFVYGLLACLIALEQRPARGGVIVLTAEEAEGEARFLMREGEDIRPLAVGRLVAVRGADDYSELVTLDGNRLVQTRLAEFERMLDPARFVRVHRSAIVNLDRMVRAEPAGGGRLLIHLEAGPPVHASRAGAKALKDRTL
ncbi:LytTR family DNA-binding domain-containing protein [Brevundimonas sp. AAP58]|uniref:LytTR family DNA-binding domain-containing protein n=1 Tax=Brevundimonas sp. AAP58 TaxID=1523422 RepID=UPI0006B99120|nr:LytTR family DNA-binding domain-containing protein [Brevundimonas sp. AAP58]